MMPHKLRAATGLPLVDPTRSRKKEYSLMSSRTQALMDRYLDILTASLFRDVHDTSLCVEALLAVTAKMQNQKHCWEDESLFFFDVKTRLYAYILQKLKENASLRQKIKTHLATNFINLSDLYHDICQSRFPRNEIAKLYFIHDQGPQAIANMLKININTVKYHLKELKKRHPPLSSSASDK